MAGRLVLTRGVGERVEISTPQGLVIVVTLERLEAGAARLSFRAPPEVLIDRSEVAAAKRHARDYARQLAGKSAAAGGP